MVQAEGDEGMRGAAAEGMTEDQFRTRQVDNGVEEKWRT